MASKIYYGCCIYCNQLVDTSKDDNFYSKTKRKTIVLFHGDCYKRYEKLCGDWVK